MRPRRTSLTLACALGCVLSLAGLTAERAAAGPAMSSVVVNLTARADLTNVRGTGPERVRNVVKALEATARTSQAPLLRWLSTQQSAGTVRSSTSMWVSNSVAVTATDGVIAQLASRPDVASVEPDAITLAPDATATTNQTAIKAPSVWAGGDTGQGVVVASLDSGVDATHPDLSSRWRGGADSWFDPYGQHPGTPVDLMGHGTGVMGVMVGGDSSGTTIGTAPGATWIAARVFNDAGQSTTSAVHQAFQWLLDPDHDPATADAPQVVNASWSIGTAPGCDLTFQPDVQALRAAGVATVFPAGNFGPGTSSSVSPANYPEALSVGAVNDTGTVTASSGRGPTSCGGRTRVFPDVVAPGVEIQTTDRWGLYQYSSGTSVAAPHATGVLALVAEASPGLTLDQLQDVLLGTAVDLGDPGPDDAYGHGEIDADAAVRAAPAPPPPPPPPPSLDVTLSPAQATVQQPGVARYQVQVTGADGFADDVTLGISGPALNQSTATFSPAVVTGGTGTSTLSLATSSTSVPGTYGFSVSANGAGLADSVDGTVQITAPPPRTLTYSTAGSTNPAGVTGTADDADLYQWTGSRHTRVFDASAIGLPSSANVDGLDLVDPTHFYVSFSGSSTSVPGLGTVQDEDVVLYSAGVWTMFFDGTPRGLTSDNLDLDAISVANGVLYFSTLGNSNPPGVSGSADDADVYSWNGSAFARTWDASANGLGSAANLDGYVRTDATHFLASFSATATTVPGLGYVQDEDVVSYDAGVWSVWFDGTANGLGSSANLDIDALDVP